MILEEIKLQDFRCFFGESRISFSDDPEKNVTLIYAENGVGKTTLLNALLWCFYGETTERFEKKDDILNYDAKRAGHTQASVEVSFEHNESRYVAKRFWGKAVGEDNFKISRIEAGSHIPLPTPDTFINTVIPKDMAGHFLFDGEYAENFSSEENRSSVRSAVRDILGCTLVEIAIDDLKEVSKSFRKNISTETASKDIETINLEIESQTVQMAKAEEQLQAMEKDRAAFEDQVKGIEQKLRDTAHAKSLQKERDTLETQKERAEKRRSEHEADIFKWLGDFGRFIVSKKITEEAHDYLEIEASKGRIPAPYNEDFVQSLLARQKCICERPLEPGSPEMQSVACLLHQAANKIMLDRVTKIRARILDLKNQRNSAPGKLIEAKKRLALTNEEISSLEGKLGEISDNLKNINVEEISLREAKREELRDKIKGIDRAVGVLNHNILLAQSEIKSKERQVDEIAQKDMQTKTLVRKKNLCEKIRGRLELRLAEEEKVAQAVLRSSIRKILDKTSRKNFKLKMSEDYALNLVNEDGNTLPRSSGENQLLGLAFTAALVEYAKTRQKDKTPILLPGTVAPLVLDSPFGQLDKVYKTSTAEFIPQMSSQVVLMLSQTQGDPEVLEVLRPYIGAEYLLIRHNKGERGERDIEERVVGGERIQITEFNSSFDGTQIKQIKQVA